MKKIAVYTELKITYKGEEYSNFANASIEVKNDATKKQVDSMKKALIKVLESHSKQLLEHDELVVHEITKNEYEANTEDNL